MTDLRDPPPAGARVPAVNGCFLDRLLLIAAARGRRGDRAHLAAAHGIRGDGFALATVLAVARDLGLAAEHRRLAWAELGRIAPCLPALLVFRDGSTAILEGLDPPDPPADTGPTAVRLRNEGADHAQPAHLALSADELALFWAGDALVPAPTGSGATGLP